MYYTLLVVHSVLRWLVLLGLITAVIVAARGINRGAFFTSSVNLIRHWTATLAHIQLVVGLVLYFKSPVVKVFLINEVEGINEPAFFGWLHGSLMLVSIVVLTIGSALTKRRHTDSAKYKTMVVWFGLALFIILIAIPWPFSPLAQRPYFR